MSVFHVVAFKVSDPATLPALSEAMLALKHDCKRNGRSYILQALGGKQSNKEGNCGGMQVVFLMEFVEDADYYINEDPVHTAFKAKLGGWGLDSATVLDFSPGIF